MRVELHRGCTDRSLAGLLQSSSTTAAAFRWIDPPRVVVGGVDLGQHLTGITTSRNTLAWDSLEAGRYRWPPIGPCGPVAPVAPGGPGTVDAAPVSPFGPCPPTMAQVVGSVGSVRTFSAPTMCHLMP